MADSLATTAATMAQEAEALLALLDTDQRARISLPLHDEGERSRWYYTPTPRAGLSLLHMNPLQRQKLRRLLAAGLSEGGYNCVSTIIGLESVVDRWLGFPDRTYGDLPDTRLRDPSNYFAAIFGTPGDARGWGWRIGGHHVSVHFTIRDGAISPTPAFFGVEPSYVLMPGGVLMRPLAAEEDTARHLLALLRPEQRERAIISPVAPFDIVQANRPRVENGALPWPDTFGIEATQRLRQNLGITDELDELVRYTPSPKGLPYDDMDAAQRDAFVRLVRVYLDRVQEPIAAQFAALTEAESLRGMTFAWAGPAVTRAPERLSEARTPYYYRIQGEHLLIEFDNAQNETNHAHSVWRDPAGDFGRDVLAEHHAVFHR
jgi:hypothetical protein